MSFIKQISLATRLNDWRFSFVPFIMGCVYMWLWWFKITLTGASVALLSLSLLTTAGFASLGYLINEFFDISSDLMAGKRNRLAYLPAHYILLLFTVSVTITFLPWLFLPANKLSFVFIGAEISAFLLYSLPFLRLKNVVGISNIIDASYAYIIPLALSFHTFHLFPASQHIHSTTSIFVLIVIAGLAGVRNIILHQVDDVFNDKRIGNKTIPILTGPQVTTKIVVALLLLECMITTAWIIRMAYIAPIFSFWGAVYIAVVGYRLKGVLTKNFHARIFIITPAKHITDDTQQVIFPFFSIVLAVIADWRWLCILPVHLAFIVSPDKIVYIRHRAAGAYHTARIGFQHFVIYPLSLLVNYSIYFTFLLAGVNLKARNESAWQVLTGALKRLLNAKHRK